MTDNEELISWLNLFSVLKNTNFDLSSGQKSNFYIDVKKTALSGRVQKLLAKLLWEKIVSEFHTKCGVVEAVAGVALGGCHLASIVAMHAPYNLDVIHIRTMIKDHGTRSLLERPHMFEEQQVVLLEDVVTTGTSAIESAKILEKEKFHVLGIVAVVDRRLEKTSCLANQWPFVSLVNIEQLDV